MKSVFAEIAGHWDVVLYGAVALVSLVFGATVLHFATIYIRALFSGAKVSLSQLIALRLRGIPRGTAWPDAFLGIGGAARDIGALELTGSGSVRHIWSTWRMEPGQDAAKARQVLLRVFLDGESQPAIQGSLDEVFRAAEAGWPSSPAWGGVWAAEGG